jgi:ribose transport system permease protein
MEALRTLPLRRFAQRQSWLFALFLFFLALLLNRAVQDNLFEGRVFNSNLRLFLPLIFVAVAQTIVVIGGGVDLSLGAIVSMVNTILVTTILADATTGQIVIGVILAVLAGTAAGAVNGLCVAYLRLQPIVTTFATGFIFSGLALFILPIPGGSLPTHLPTLFRGSTPLGIPLTLWIVALLIVLWLLLISTRYGRYLFAVGGHAQAAYATGVPVNFVRFSTYVLAGFIVSFGAMAITLSTGTGEADIGDTLTLASVVAVVIGGTRLRGGQGGIIGSIFGVLALGFVRNVISFTNVPSWWQPLVDASIIILALTGPGLVQLIRRLVRGEAV